MRDKSVSLFFNKLQTLQNSLISTTDQKVGGSNPSGRAIIFNNLHRFPSSAFSLVSIAKIKLDNIRKIEIIKDKLQIVENQWKKEDNAVSVTYIIPYQLILIFAPVIYISILLKPIVTLPLILGSYVQKFL